LPHQKYNREAAMPHFEKVTQIKADYPAATAIGSQYGLNHEIKNNLPGRFVHAIRKPDGKRKRLS
jgi:hypothetical protein